MNFTLAPSVLFVFSSLASYNPDVPVESTPEALWAKGFCNFVGVW
ncbi:hypothetical protein WDW86_01465 [Bdellovibrionota bacterium FG-2]